jgi:chemotaxis protein CheC
LVLENMLDIRLDDYAKIGELERSTMIEVGNIMISTFINALCGLADISINLTVPAFTVDMQGAIMAVPMAEYGGQSNYIMTIGSDFLCEGKRVPCRLLLSPDLRSLDFLMRKLGVGE